MSFHIRLFATSDLTTITGIIDATELFPSELLADMTAGYLNDQTDDLWWVLETETQVTGLAYCAPERMTDGTWNLLAIAVHPDYQGKGFGYALIDHTRKAIRDKGARLFLIETADIPEFAAQRSLYERAGLSQMAHIPEYYEAGVGKVTFGQAL